MVLEKSTFGCFFLVAFWKRICYTVFMIKDTILEDGCKFTGNFEEGLRHGYGIKTYPNGATYAGWYECDVRHGKGVKTHADGTEVHVVYDNGRRQPWQW